MSGSSQTTRATPTEGVDPHTDPYAPAPIAPSPAEEGKSNAKPEAPVANSSDKGSEQDKEP